MGYFSRTLLLSSALLFSAVYAVDEVNDEDIQALRDWINSKRMITVKELGGQLSISGEIRAEMQATTVTKDGVALRGKNSHIPNNAYDVEFNLSIDYRTENTWAAARARFDNDAGIHHEHLGSGTNNKIRVDKAYFGYRVIDRDRHTAEVVVGRRQMFAIFDSKVQFASNFDGVNFQDVYSIDQVGDVYYNLGAFIVNEKKDRAAYIGELGILNVANTGFYSKYSMVDWATKNPKNTVFRREFRFIVSQLLLGYKFIPQPWDKVINFYLAGLYNHRARRLPVSDNKRANFGGYLGFSIGQLKQAGDWNFEATYQLLAAQCVPSFDMLGVGLGSRGGHDFYSKKEDDHLVAINEARNAEGNVNFRAFKLTLQYLLTNNLTLFQEWSQSIRLDSQIGPFRRYKQYELELIYAF